jgi:hypothetical protein
MLFADCPYYDNGVGIQNTKASDTGWLIGYSPVLNKIAMQL